MSAFFFQLVIFSVPNLFFFNFLFNIKLIPTHPTPPFTKSPSLLPTSTCCQRSLLNAPSILALNHAASSIASTSEHSLYSMPPTPSPFLPSSMLQARLLRNVVLLFRAPQRQTSNHHVVATKTTIITAHLTLFRCSAPHPHAQSHRHHASPHLVPLFRCYATGALLHQRYQSMSTGGSMTSGDAQRNICSSSL